MASGHQEEKESLCLREQYIKAVSMETQLHKAVHDDSYLESESCSYCYIRCLSQ